MVTNKEVMLVKFKELLKEIDLGPLDKFVNGGKFKQMMELVFFDSFCAEYAKTYTTKESIDEIIKMYNSDVTSIIMENNEQLKRLREQDAPGIDDKKYLHSSIRQLYHRAKMKNPPRYYDSEYMNELREKDKEEVNQFDNERRSLMERLANIGLALE